MPPDHLEFWIGMGIAALTLLIFMMVGRKAYSDSDSTLYLVASFVAVGSLPVLLVVQGPRVSRYVRSLVPTEADVQNKYFLSNRSRDHKVFYIVLLFIANETEYQLRTRISEDLFERIGEGERLNVRHNRENPVILPLEEEK
jgi:hypothetical protein